MWLGLPMFNTDPPPIATYPCRSLIDQYGDHLLNCRHGPYRIRRHEALCGNRLKQDLSCTLWTYNSKIILHYFSTMAIIDPKWDLLSFA